MTDQSLDAAIESIAANPPVVVGILLFAAAAAFVTRQLCSLSD